MENIYINLFYVSEYNTIWIFYIIQNVFEISMTINTTKKRFLI